MEQDTHIVKSYDDEMKEINNSILDIGSLVENQLKEALGALKNQDTELADKVIQADNLIDENLYKIYLINFFKIIKGVLDKIPHLFSNKPDICCLLPCL